MAGAMVWTLLADAIPVAERTSVFYLLYSMILILGVVVNPIAAFLLKIDAWFALWLGFGILIAGPFASLLVPETLTLRKMADNKRSRSMSADGVASVNKPLRRSWFQYAVFTMKNDMGHIVRFIFASKGVMILIFAYAIIVPVRLNQVFNLLQYMTKRFNWEWSTVRLVCVMAENMVSTG
jgi:MFS family permease